MPSLSQKLSKKRKEQGLSLRDVSKETGLAIATLSKVENEAGEITAKTLEKLQVWLSGGPPVRFQTIECNQQFRYVTGYEEKPCRGCAVCDSDGYYGYHDYAVTQSVFDIVGYQLHSWNFIPDDAERILVVLERV